MLIPGIGVEVNGAKRWIGAGLFQIQPSEIAKVALILYGAHLLATRPKLTRTIGDMVPFLARSPWSACWSWSSPTSAPRWSPASPPRRCWSRPAPGCATSRCSGGAVGVVIVLAIMIEPYRMERLTGFLDPTADPAGAGFQANQAQIALGSGGIFGVGLGESLQKAFYLPEAHTDMIAAVIGEELGLVGIAMLVGLFGLFGYAGLRTAQRARDRYTKLLAAGLTSLVLVQATINLFAVLGPRAAHRRAAAVRLLRELEPAGDAGRGRHSLLEHRPRSARLRDCASSTVREGNGSTKSRR